MAKPTKNSSDRLRATSSSGWLGPMPKPASVLRHVSVRNIRDQLNTVSLSPEIQPKHLPPALIRVRQCRRVYRSFSVGSF